MTNLKLLTLKNACFAAIRRETAKAGAKSTGFCKRPIIPAVFAVVFAVWPASCGLEEYSYISSVPQGNITVVLNNTATIQLPGSIDGPFSHFNIFYRIYVSSLNLSGQAASSALSAINPSLDSDYRAIPKTDVTSNKVNDTNIESIFRNRGYYEMFVEGNTNRMRELLDSGSLGKTIVINFPPNTGGIPELTVDGASYKLYRSTGNDIVQNNPNKPLPDNRYFQNDAQLNAGPNSTDNLDVEGNSAASAPKYTYVSLYIAAVGATGMTRTFSTPTFIGILKLPQSN
jgi:hypothetical protein